MLSLCIRLSSVGSCVVFFLVRVVCMLMWIFVLWYRCMVVSVVLKLFCFWWKWLWVLCRLLRLMLM